MRSAGQPIDDDNDEHKAFGLRRYPKNDCFRFKVALDLASHIGMVRSGPNLT